MAFAHVQDCASQVAASGNPLTAAITFGGAVTVGNTLFVGISQNVSGFRGYTVSDNIVGTDGWIRAVRYISPFGTTASVEVWRRANHPGGSVTITVTHGQATVGFNAAAGEFSGFGTVAVEEVYGKTDTGVSHTSAPGFTNAKELLSFVSCNVTSAAAVALVPGTGYTRLPSGATSLNHMFMWKYFASGCTAETGAWQSTNASRTGNSAIALFSYGDVIPVSPNLEGTLTLPIQPASVLTPTVPACTLTVSPNPMGTIV